MDPVQNEPQSDIEIMTVPDSILAMLPKYRVTQPVIEEKDFLQQIIDSKRTVRNLSEELDFNPIAGKSPKFAAPEIDVEDLAAEHFALRGEDSTVSQVSELEIDDSLSVFLAATEAPVDLLPTQSQDEQVEYPYLFTDRLTPMELSFYKQSKLLLGPGDNTSGSMQFYLRLPEETIKLGRIMPSLRAFLAVKRICNTRKIFMAFDSETSSELDDSDLSVFLLEDFE